MKKNFGQTMAIAVIFGTVGLDSNVIVVKAAEKQEYTSKATVNFITNTDPSNPIDPEDPNPDKPINPIDPIDPTKPINPGTDGPLSIDFVSNLNFGTGKITTKGAVYHAYAQQIKKNDDDTNPIIGNYRPNYVQVTDNRGTEAGWSLTVKQKKQLTSTEGKELTGASIKMSKSTLSTASGSTAVVPVGAPEVTLIPGGDSSIVIYADEGAGAGVWVNYFGTSQDTLSLETDLKPLLVEGKEANEFNVIRNSAVTLSVPGASVKTDSNYTTELTWILSEIPTNSRL